jgi:hypothetical protein
MGRRFKRIDTMARRDLLASALVTVGQGLIGQGLIACAVVPPPAPIPVPPPLEQPDRVVAQLTDLLTAAGLGWLVLMRPKRLAETAWLEPSIARVLRKERIELLARATGVDLREVVELALAGYGDGSIMWLLRHSGAPLETERKFRDRLTGNVERAERGHQLVRVWGDIGQSPHGFVSIGRDVVGFQYGGSKDKGPARIAILYANGELRRIGTALADPALGHIDLALGLTPVKVMLAGPFEGDLGRGARGLLAAADGVGASLAPTDRASLDLALIVAGDYGAEADRDEALALLEASWRDVVAADLGHLLGLDRAKGQAHAFAVPLGLALRVELDAALLFDGLAAATVDSVRDIMR